jgi:uncharacterized membrane protein YGL010W
MSPKIRTPSLAERLFIVPAAHTRLADVAFQAEMYELFHRTPAGRIGHMIGTPTILLGVLVLTSRAPGAAAPLLAVALAFGIAAWGLVIDRLAGLVTSIATALLAVSAFVLARALGPETALAAALALVLGGCSVQTFSHAFEDVPPPLSGAAEFVPPSAWLRRARLREVVRAASLTVGVFFWLEMWATFRILPLQVLHLLMRAGHRPELRSALDARVSAILAAPASDWKQPSSPARGSSMIARSSQGAAR